MCGNGERGRAEIRSPGNGGPICRGNIIKAWGTEALGLNQPTSSAMGISFLVKKKEGCGMKMARWQENPKEKKYILSCPNGCIIYKYFSDIVYISRAQKGEKCNEN